MHYSLRIKIKSENIVPLTLKREMLIRHRVWMVTYGQFPP